MKYIDERLKKCILKAVPLSPNASAVARICLTKPTVVREVLEAYNAKHPDAKLHYNTELSEDTPGKLAELFDAALDALLEYVTDVNIPKDPKLLIQIVDKVYDKYAAIKGTAAADRELAVNINVIGGNENEQSE